MPQPDYSQFPGLKIMSPAEEVAAGLRPPGPLAPALTSGASPTENNQAIRAMVNPDPQTPQDLSALPKGPGGFPIVPPSMRGQVTNPFPSFTGQIGQNIKTRYPQIAAQIAGTMVGNPYLGALAGGGSMAGGKLLQGESPTKAATAGGLTAGLGAAIPGIVQGAAATVASGPFRQVFAKQTMQQLGEYLKARIPTLSGFKADEKGVFQMLIGPRGFAKVHKWYDDYLKGVVAQGANKEITIPASAAEVLGIDTIGGHNFSQNSSPAVREALVRAGKLASSPGPWLQTGVKVNAADAAIKMTGRWEKNPGEYQAVAKALDEAGIGDPSIRSGYKAWIGLRQHMSQTNAFKGERYHPEKAMGGLTKIDTADELSRRGLGEAIGIIRGPGKHPITESGINPWMKRATGGAAGEIGMEMLGMPKGLGFPVGLLAAEALVPQYRHVPIPQNFLQSLHGVAPQVAAQAGQQVTSTNAQ